MCYRDELPLRGNNTNNLCEAKFLVIKDEILNRQKEVNIVGLLDKFTTELDQHYCNKLLSVSSGKKKSLPKISQDSSQNQNFNLIVIDKIQFPYMY
jgi:hypothetical protein